MCVATKANIENCTVWKKNLAKNQTDVYPILDATLVKDPAKPDSYVNMSSVIVPHCSYPILMGQIPKRGLEEEFWRAAYNEQVVMMYVLVGSEDEKYDFFPKTTGSFLYYGEMFVNVRKVSCGGIASVVHSFLTGRENGRGTEPVHDRGASKWILQLSDDESLRAYWMGAIRSSYQICQHHSIRR